MRTVGPIEYLNNRKTVNTVYCLSHKFTVAVAKTVRQRSAYTVGLCARCNDTALVFWY